MTSGKPLHSTFEDAWLVDGVRTPFVDYNGALAATSPIDLGIKVARSVFERTRISPRDVGTVIAGSMAQASFDAYMLPRHIGLYSGRSNRSAGASRATRVRHWHRGADAGRRHGLAWSGRSRALRRHRVR